MVPEIGWPEPLVGPFEVAVLSEGSRFLLSARADGLCVEAPPPVLGLVVCGSFTVWHRVCCSSCRASTWLHKAHMAWSKASCLSPGRGAWVFSFLIGDMTSMMLLLSGSGSSSPSQCFPITAKLCRSFGVS